MWQVGELLTAKDDKGKSKLIELMAKSAPPPPPDWVIRSSGFLCLNPPEDKRSYSSVYEGSAIGTGYARSMIDSEGWAARHNNQDQWMIVDAGKTVAVLGVIVQGSVYQGGTEKEKRGERVH